MHTKRALGGLSVVLAVVASSTIGVATHQIVATAAPGPAPTSCQLGNGVSHVVQITFDNVHFFRDNPNVPSDLELMPHLLNFIEGNGTMLSSNVQSPIPLQNGERGTRLFANTRASVKLAAASSSAPDSRAYAMLRMLVRELTMSYQNGPPSPTNSPPSKRPNRTCQSVGIPKPIHVARFSSVRHCSSALT